MEDGGFWHVKPELSTRDTAYSNLALNAHTDSSYFVRQ